jgi:peptidoglycan hydrolase-like protein with peptidoglycan-binding domain
MTSENITFTNASNKLHASHNWQMATHNTKMVFGAAAFATILVAGIAMAAKQVGPFSTPPLKLDSAGPSVKAAKTLLNKHGSYFGKIDTKFGPDLQIAVMNFQNKWDIYPVDGIIGPKTWKNLLSIKK